MDFNALKGKTYFEAELYELLLFEIEENFNDFFGQFVHLYFERTNDGKIMINDVLSFSDGAKADEKSRSIIEKKEWLEILENEDHIDLFLVRLDRTGSISVAWKDRTLTHPWKYGWLDEGPPRPPLTPEEIRLAFNELLGVFEDQQELQKSKSKIAV